MFPSALDLVPDRIAVHQVQGLGQGRRLHPLLQDVAPGESECDKEIVRPVGNVDVLCRRAFRVALERVRDASDLAEDVEEHFRREPARYIACKERAVERVGSLGPGRELVRARVEDEAVQRLEPEAAAREELRQTVQKSRIRGPVRRAKVVKGLDDPGAEILVPDPVHRGSREVGVLGRDDPVGQDCAPVLPVGDLGGGPLPETWVRPVPS